MDAGQVGLGVDPALGEVGDHGVAVGPGRQPDGVDEPAAPLLAPVGAGQHEARRVAVSGRCAVVERREPLACRAPAAARPGRQHLVEALELGDAERRLELGEPVVEAEPVVVDPVHVRGPALVSLAAQAARPARGRRPRACPPPPWSSACSRRRRTRRRWPREPTGRPSASTAPSASQASSSRPSPPSEAIASSSGSAAGIAEDVDRQQARGALADRIPGRGRVEVQGDRVDVAEDRRRALVEQAVGRGDEAERRGDDLVALAPARARAPRGAGPRCPRRPRPRRRPRASRRRRARSAPASVPARAGPSAAPRAPAPPRARRARAARAGFGRRGQLRLARPRHSRRRSRGRGGLSGLLWLGTRTRASRRAPPRRPR